MATFRDKKDAQQVTSNGSSFNTNQRLLIGAIDLGTTFSGYAFSFRDEYLKDPLKIRSNQAWNAGSSVRLLSQKTPTCLLLNKSKEMIAFGYEAENAYAELLLDGKHQEYFYFTRFKMFLYNTEKLTEDVEILDISGKSMSAMTVFSMSIKALKDHMFETVQKQVKGIYMSDIGWILTVPAMWSENGKQFMRRSAEKAGIDPERLRIALEPEAASIYCQHLPTERHEGEEVVSVASVGTKYAVVDVGGGTADITIHERMNDGHLREVCCTSGNGCGGTAVDAAFSKLLMDILGSKAFDALKEKYIEEYLEIIRVFEYKKRDFNYEKPNHVLFRIPLFDLNALTKKYTVHDTFNEAVSASKYAKDVSIRRDKMSIASHLFKALFDPTIDGIVNLLREMLNWEETNDITHIILVGGFSRCSLLEKTIETAFPKQTIIVPEESELSIVKGAVIFGHRPDIILERISKYTYGFSKRKTFDRSIHDEDHLLLVNGEEKCSRVFVPIILKNEPIPFGKRITSHANTKPGSGEYFTLKIYQTENQQPMYTDEKDVSVLGEIRVKRTDPKATERIKVVTTFGGTEIDLKIVELKHDTVAQATLEMI